MSASCLGIGVCGYRSADGSDHFVALPGDDVRVSFPKATLPPEAINEFYTIVDFYESKMSEYDASFVFVPLKELQKSRGMIDPTTGVGKFTSIQIKLAPGAECRPSPRLPCKMPFRHSFIWSARGATNKDPCWRR